MKIDITQRTFDFAVRIVKLCQHLDEQSGVARTIGWQLLRAGTAIGSNMEEAQAAQGRPDFMSKCGIALKAARETLYWLRLIVAAEILPALRLSDIQKEADEIAKIVGAIIVSTKGRV
ncbi:MAG TPA: four helix bundle protein [Pyrinomonadaceae bacterium]|nr:four helix bundle protein [Pyrinomonadaceae bacterium]